MKIKVEHTTRFEYDAPVYESTNQVRLQPIDNHGSPQSCQNFTLTVLPAANIYQYVDYFGNSVHHFSVLSHHTELEIKAVSTVDTGFGRMGMQPNEDVRLVEYLTETQHVNFSEAIKQFATQFKRREPFELAEDICRALNATLIYEKGVTNIYSSAGDVLDLGRGVCQDFAHVMIAVCRVLELPARYISGYIYGGQESEGQDGASHAWCEVFGGASQDWLGFDATRSSLYVDERYVRVAHGRDYSDITPVRGTFKGGTSESMTVRVRLSAF